MCNILKTADRRAKRNKIGTQGPTKNIYRVFVMSGATSLVWDYSVHFAKSSDVKSYQKVTAPTVVTRFIHSTKLMESMVIRGNTGYYFIAILQFFLKL